MKKKLAWLAVAVVVVAAIIYVPPIIALLDIGWGLN